MTDQIIQSANPAAKTSHSTQLRNWDSNICRYI
jgi:hypothetical protein